MKIVGLLFSISVVFSSFGQLNQTDAQGRKQGKWAKTYPGTRVYQYKGQFKDDKPVGKFQYFYKSNKPKAIIEHDENSNRSVAYFYHENGRLLSYGIYRNQQKDSTWIGLDEYKTVRLQENYKNGKLHGKKVEYYAPIKGTKQQVPLTVKNYKEGVLHGDFVEYYENRGVREKGSYLNGKKHGVWHTFHATGKKMMLNRYKNGKRHGWCYGYDDSGKQAAKHYFYNGKRYEGKELQDLLDKINAKKK